MKILYGNTNLNKSSDIINISKEQITKEELNKYANLFVLEIKNNLMVLKNIIDDTSKYKWDDIKEIVLLGICLDYGIVKILEKNKLINFYNNEKYIWDIDFPEINLEYSFGVKIYEFYDSNYLLFQLWKYKELNSIYRFSQKELDVINGRSKDLESTLILKSYGIINNKKIDIPIITPSKMPELFNQIDKLMKIFYNEIIIDIQKKSLSSKEKHGIVRLITIFIYEKLINEHIIFDQKQNNTIWMMEA